jgi:hypothetical protein
MTATNDPGFWKSVAKDLAVQNALAGTVVAVLVASTKFILFRG